MYLKHLIYPALLCSAALTLSSCGSVIDNVKEQTVSITNQAKQGFDLLKRKNNKTNTQTPTVQTSTTTAGRTQTASKPTATNTTPSTPPQTQGERLPKDRTYTIASTDKKIFRDITIHAYNGIPFGNRFGNTSKHPASQHIRELTHNYDAFLDLLALKQIAKRAKPSKAVLKAVGVETERNSLVTNAEERQRLGLSPNDAFRASKLRNLVTRLGRHLMTEDALRYYMCEETCNTVFRTRWVKQVGGTWGGKGNPFHAKRRYEEFLDKELDKMIAIAAKVPDTYYVYGDTTILGYSFNKKAVVVQNLSPIHTLRIRSSRVDVLREKHPFKKVPNEVHPSYGSLLPMSESNGEDFLKRYTNTALYFLYKITIGSEYHVAKEDIKTVNIISGENIFSTIEKMPQEVLLFDSKDFDNNILAVAVKP